MTTAPRLITLVGNQRRLTEVLRALGPSTRADLAGATGLSRATISATLGDLADIGLIIEPGGTTPAGPAGGRPASVVQLSSAAGVAVGVDIGRRHLNVAVADLAHSVLAENGLRLAPHEEHTASIMLDRAATLVREALAEAGHSIEDVVGVGLGLPAPVVTSTGLIGASNILPAWSGLTPADELSSRLGVPVCVENDANLGALSEHLWGAGRASKSLVYLKLATGIGGGMVIDGRLFRGVSGTAGEIGHLTLDAQGDVCRCGNRGCLELVAGGTALVEVLRRTHPEVQTLPDLVRLAMAGDAPCRRLVADAGTHLGVALGGMVNLINPDMVVVGGELGRAGNVLLDPLRHALSRSAVPSAVDAVTVVQGVLGDRAEVLGAVALVLRESDRLPSHA
ncbi:MAG TPA: ROK family transcriptional regulator [Nocardioides sp.]|jgi:predicted NBD/HSP70 family sugar kinase